jgi:hypothetical protein
MYIRAALPFHGARVPSVDHLISIILLSFDTAVKINAASLCTVIFTTDAFREVRKQANYDLMCMFETLLCS